jgi:outer membrane protein, heavy metal efflux system
MKLLLKMKKNQFSPYLVCLIGFSLSGCCGSSSNDFQYRMLSYELSQSSIQYKTSSEFDEDGCISLFEGNDHLDRDELIRAVLNRNPSIDSARQAWQVAIYRYPQVIALDDPMMAYAFAPDSLGNKTFNDQPLRFGQTIELSQKFPFPGKRSLQGKVTLAEAQKMQGDFESVKLELALTASTFFDDYYLIEKALEVNAHHLILLRDSKSSMESRYVTGGSSQEDLLQVELEIEQMLHEKVTLESQRKIIIAKINGLLHRKPEMPLPLPPTELPIYLFNPGITECLQEEAIQLRPDLAAIRAQIEGGKAAIRLAELQNYPDFELKASYETLWDQPEYRPMVGVAINIPFIQQEKRNAAIREATSNYKRLESEYVVLEDKIRVEVEEALQGIIQNQRLVQLWKEKGIPLAEAKLASATATFESGQRNLMTLLDVDRNLRNIELRFYSALANLWKQRAQLNRALGRYPDFMKYQYEVCDD